MLLLCYGICLKCSCFGSSPVSISVFSLVVLGASVLGFVASCISEHCFPEVLVVFVFWFCTIIVDSRFPSDNLCRILNTLLGFDPNKVHTDFTHLDPASHLDIKHYKIRQVSKKVSKKKCTFCTSGIISSDICPLYAVYSIHLPVKCGHVEVFIQKCDAISDVFNF